MGAQQHSSLPSSQQTMRPKDLVEDVLFGLGIEAAKHIV